MRFSTILMVWVLSFPAPLFAQAENETFIFDFDVRYINLILNKAVKVSIDDQISDGCWRNSASSRNAVQVELLRSGFEILPDENVGPTIYLSGLGYRTDSGLCITFIDLNVRVYDFSSHSQDGYKVSSLFAREIASYKTVLSGPSPNSDSRIRDTFVDNIQEFIIDLNSSKRNLRDKISSNGEPSSADYWNSVLDN